MRIVRNARAKRYVLRLRADQSARLTVPRGGSVTEAKAFLQRHIEWLERAARRQAALPRLDARWKIGTSILWRGESVVIDRTADAIFFGSESLNVPDATADLRPAIERHIWKRACVELPPRVVELAQRFGITVSGVSVRNQRSRWGSCSAQGTISLNWRLLQAPASVCDYLIIHELMHRRAMNHSKKFWQHVADACPDYRQAERWLNEHGYLLR